MPVRFFPDSRFPGLKSPGFSQPGVRTNTCPVFSKWPISVPEISGLSPARGADQYLSGFLVGKAPSLTAASLCGASCRLKLVRLRPVRSSSADEHPRSLGAALAGGVEHRDHQCALQLADRSGSTSDRHRRTARSSLSRRGCGRRGLCDGVLGGVWLRPTNRGGPSVCLLGAQRAPLSTALCARRDGGARPG
jgi:hypothetical protein